jgi:uncharacterized protein HemX
MWPPMSVMTTKSTFKSCPRCKTPVHETNRLTCRRCGSYIQPTEQPIYAGSVPVGTILGLIVVAAIVGFSCYAVMQRSAAQQQATSSVQTVQQTQTSTDQNKTQPGAQTSGKRRRGRHH